MDNCIFGNTINRFGYTLALLLLLVISIANAQPTQKIDIADIFEHAVVDTALNELEFEGYNIEFNKLSGKTLYNHLSALYPEKVNDQGLIEISANITFSNCVFDRSLDFEKFIFKGLTIAESTLENQRFGKCFFESLKLEKNKMINSLELTGIRSSTLEISGNTLGYELYMENDSIIGGDAFIENNIISFGEIIISGSYFNGSITVGNNQVSGILIENSHFVLPEYGEFNNYKLTENASSDLYLTANRFEGDQSSKVLFNKGNYLNLDLRDNYFGVDVYFIENKAEERFFLVNNEFEGHVSFEKFLFSETWNELYWSQLSGYKLRYAEYAGESKEELEDGVRFNNLVNIYKGLHTIFLSRGDIESANACYSEMKELQGRKLKQAFRTNKTFGNFLRWQLNVLLKVYTNHGTDPALPQSP